MKAHHLTIKTNPVAEAHPLFKEARDFARELNKLTEGKQLNVGEIHTLFTNAEQAMTATGGNRTMLGKAGEMAGALGQKIRGLAQSLQDTTPVKGVDSMFDDLKNKASAAMSKSPQGSSVLRKIDQYKQIVQRHPNTSKFFWGVAGVLTGLLTGGVAPVVALGAMKTIDGLLQDKQLSTSVGGGLSTMGTAMGAKALAHAGQAAAQGVHNAADAVSNIHLPSGGDQVVPNGPTDVTPGPSPTDVTPGPNPAPAPGPTGAETTTIKVPANSNLSTLADQYGTSVEHLQQLNPTIKNADVLAQGQAVVVPAKATGLPTYDHGVGTNANTMAGIKQGTIPNSPISQGLAAKAAAAPKAAKAATVSAESVKVKHGKGILEGCVVYTLPLAALVDKQSTVRRWALSESLGRARPNGVELSKKGIDTIFFNLEQIHESFVKEADERIEPTMDEPAPTGRVFSRPANANDPRAMAKNKATAGTNVSSAAGPQGQLPGGPSPVGNTMPYLAADPEGQFDTKYKGGISSKLSRGVETGLGRAGNWIKDKWKDSTTKVTANGLKRHWADAGSPTDSDQVASILQRLKVPNDVIGQLYQQLNFPAPNLASAGPEVTSGAQAAAGADAQGQATPQGDVDYDNLANAIRGSAADVDADGNSRQLNPNLKLMHQNDRAADAKRAAQGAMGGDGSVADRLMGGGADSTGGGSSMGDGQISAATNSVLPQIARMTGPANADDLITIIDTAMSVLQRSSPNAYRDKIAQFRGQSTGQQTAKPQDMVKKAKLGPNKVVANNPGAPTDDERNKFDQRVAQATGTLGESKKRTYGGKYVKESADKKLARQFENFLLKME